MKSLISETTMERIKLYYLSDNVELSSHDQQLRERWEAAYSMLINQNGTKREVVKMLMKVYDISFAMLVAITALIWDFPRADLSESLSPPVVPITKFQPLLM